MKEQRKNTNENKIKRVRRRKNRKENRILFFIVILILCLAIVGVIFLMSHQSSDADKDEVKKAESIEIEGKPIDSEALEELIAESEKINRQFYTEESIQMLEEQVGEAEELLKSDAKQNDLESSYLNIVNAIQSLQEKEEVSEEMTE